MSERRRVLHLLTGRTAPAGPGAPGPEDTVIALPEPAEAGKEFYDRLIDEVLAHERVITW